jgi:hypothetical protein
MAGPLTALETRISQAATTDQVQVERATVEAIRKAEKEQREQLRAQRRPP